VQQDQRRGVGIHELDQSAQLISAQFSFRRKEAVHQNKKLEPTQYRREIYVRPKRGQKKAGKILITMRDGIRGNSKKGFLEKRGGSRPGRT